MDRTLGVSKRDPDSSHLALRNKCSVFRFCRLSNFFWMFRDAAVFLHVSDVHGFFTSANKPRAFFRKTAPVIYERLSEV